MKNTKNNYFQNQLRTKTIGYRLTIQNQKSMKIWLHIQYT
jgi:hypothetical protein